MFRPYRTIINLHINSMKISRKSVQCEASRSMRKVEMTKPMDAVCNSANAPNKGYVVLHAKGTPVYERYVEVIKVSRRGKQTCAPSITSVTI